MSLTSPSEMTQVDPELSVNCKKVSKMDSDDMDTSSDDGSRLCDLCSGITAGALTSVDGYQHALNLAIVSDGQGACTLCNQMWHQLERFDHVTKQDRTAGLGERPFRNVRLRAIPTPGSTDHRTREGHSLIVQFESDDAGVSAQTLPELQVWCPLGDAASAFGIPELHQGTIDTRSADTFRFIETCMDECRSHDCRQPLLRENVAHNTAPSRLLDLGHVELPSPTDTEDAQVSGSVRIVPVTPTACPPYVALSHCWGGNLDEYKTTEANLAQRLLGIDVRTLSPTFRDAVSICRRLRVSYVWIDALCIVQDSAADWNSESVIMGDIYEKAYFTISASHATDGLGGCFNHKKGGMVPDQDFLTITNAVCDDAGEESSVLIRNKRTGYVPTQDLDDSPLSKRGWVYQERFLSPRIVHFAVTQVMWECRSLLRQQRLYPITSPTVPSLARLPTSDGASGQDGVEEAVGHWYRLVRDYSAREFTKYEDRLVALAGVAQICAPRIGDDARYLAGLWSSHLAYGLAWSRVDNGHGAPQALRFPTWSWASRNHSITWKDKGGFDFSPDSMGLVLESEWLDLCETPRGRFSPIKSASITVRGRAAPLTRIDTHTLSAFGHCDIRLGDLKGDFYPDEPSGLTCLSQRAPDLLALALGCWRAFRLVVVLILVPADSKPGTYWRVGLGTAYTEAEDGAIFGSDHPPESVTIL